MYKILHAVALLALAAAARGQVTETPVTVQPGHFLLEVDALSLTIDREPGLKYTAFGAASTFLTTGLTSRLDLQVGAEFYLSQKFDAAGFTERPSGRAASVTSTSAPNTGSTSRRTPTRRWRCCPT